jgi:hypothetical protein
MLSMYTNNLEFNQNNLDDWVKDNHYHLSQLFDCFQHNFRDVLPYTQKEWQQEEENIFEDFCQFIYEYS